MFVPAARMSTGRLGRFEAMDWFHLTMRITVLTQGQAPNNVTRAMKSTLRQLRFEPLGNYVAAAHSSPVLDVKVADEDRT